MCGARQCEAAACGYNEGRSREQRMRMHGSLSAAFTQGGEAAGSSHACKYLIASEAERFEGLQKPTRLAKVHVVPGRTHGAVAASAGTR